MRSFTSLSAVALVSFALRVNAHGFVSSVVVSGTTYEGANGASASTDSPIRKVASGDPVTDETSDAIICGTSAAVASSSVSANPGDEVQLYWSAEGGGDWIHNVGPILTYMAECSSDCSSFTPDSSTEWFKIDEQGKTDGTWVQASLDTGSPATVTIPDNLQSGNYLMRHEIIALQNAVSEGGAEFYPNCIQMTIGGSGTGTADTFVNFPGAYSATDPGILVDVYTDASADYDFPGGDVATISGSSDSGSSSSDGGSSGSSSSSSSSTTQAGSAASSTGAAGASSTVAPGAASAASSTTTGSGAAATSVTGSGNSGNNGTDSSTGSGSAADPSTTGKCTSKKFKLKRRSSASSSTSTSAKKRHAQKMMRKRFAPAFGVASN